MKIGYLLELGEELRQPPFNGPANHIRQIFLQLENLGHEVALLFRQDDCFWLTRDLELFEQVRVREGSLGVLAERFVRKLQTLLHLPYVGFFESRRFARLCQQQLDDCDLYYERFTWMNYGGKMVSQKTGTVRITEYNGDPLADLDAKKTAPKGLQRAISKAITEGVLRTASHVVATGDGWGRNCVETWGVNSNRVSVVENGTDLLEILDKNRLRSFRDEAALNSQEIRIVYLGGFLPWHGIDKLLEAFCLIIEQGIHAHLTFIGSGEGEREAKRDVIARGIKNNVSFTGKLATREYAAHLADSDIGVSPYCGWPEFSGLKIFDYKAAGLACVASGKDGQPSTLQHGETGWIVTPCDEAALADALFRLSSDRSLRRRLGQSARLEAEQQHTWASTAGRLETIFQRSMR